MAPLPDVPDVYRVIHVQQFSGEEVLNIYHYRDTGALAFSPASVAQGWWDSVKASFRALQPTSGGFTSIRVDCEFLEAPRPFGSYVIPVGEQQGLRAAPTDFMPVWSAFEISLAVGTRVTRPGNKRIAGMLEGDQSSGIIIAGTVTLVQNFADKLDVVFTPTGGLGTVTPVIVGYPTPLQPGAPRVQDIVQATASGYASHQTSRDGRP